MSYIQRLVTALFPRQEGAVRAATEQWQIRCLTCGRSRSLWEVGGVRWGSRSVGKSTRTLVRCSGCGKLRMAAVERVGGATDAQER